MSSWIPDVSMHRHASACIGAPHRHSEDPRASFQSFSEELGDSQVDGPGELDEDCEERDEQRDVEEPVGAHL